MAASITTEYVTYPSPGVLLTVDPGVAGSVTGTLWRILNDATPVRGAANVTITGPTVFRDHEQPINTWVDYYWIPNGSTTATATDSVRVDAGDAWLTNPIDTRLFAQKLTCGGDHPNLAPSTATIRLARGTIDDVDHATSGEEIFVVGSRYPVHVAGAGKSVTVPLVITTHNMDELRTLTNVLNSGQPLLFRALPCMLSVPDLDGHAAYLSCTWKTTKAPTAQHPDRYVTTVTGTVVAPPGGNRVMPVLTWANVTDRYGSWSSMKTRYATWNDLIVGPRR